VHAETQLDQGHKLANLYFDANLNRKAKVGRIEVTGPPAPEAARLTRALRSLRARFKGASLKTGKPFDPERIQEASRFLRDYLGREGRLASSIRLEKPHYDAETNRADLNFQVTLGPLVSIRVTGAHIFQRTLKKLIPMYEENSFDADLVAEGQRNLVSYFQGKGYFDVKVDPQVKNEASENSVVYQINKGSKRHMAAVVLAGNQRLKRKDLMGQVIVEKGHFLSRGKFSQELVNRSVDNLRAYYRNNGFGEVKVLSQVADRAPNIYVTFRITEGPQTLVSSFHMEGNKTQSLGKLAPHGLNMKPGKPYSPSLLDSDRNQIVATYLDLGYANVSFKSTVNPVAYDPHRVAVTYLIDQGPEAHISDVAYVGGEHTKQSFIKRNTTVRPGGPVSEGTMLGSESRLYNLGVFDWAEVSPREPITDQTQEEMLVKFHEAQRNSLGYGLGFLSTERGGALTSGVVALPGLPTVGLPPKFKILEKYILSPLGSIEYSRLNLSGRGDTGSASALVSRLDQKGSLTYTDPQIIGLNWSAVWSLSAERNTENPLFAARLGTGSFQIEKVLNAAKTERLQFRYALQRTSLDDLLIQNFVAPKDTNIRMSTLSTTFIRDTRDKPLDAHKGVFQTMDLEISPTALGSSDNLARFLGQTSFYRQLKPWMIWANNFRVGMVKSFAGSHVPLSERFFSGGADSLRGFPLNGAGPQQPATLCTAANEPSTCTASITVPAGGRQLFIWNSEGRFPLPNLPIVHDGLGFVIFYDGGNVYNNIGFKGLISDYSNTVGIGLRFQTPVGPVRLDIGRNVSPVPGLKPTQYFITLGQSF
jgi:outer membrane protein assembly factor BamA